MRRQLTRTDLFDAVWARPLTTIAAEFGVSNTVLKAICDRHVIPTPKAGYCSKLAFGKAPPKPALPPVAAELEAVLIAPKPSTARAVHKAPVEKTPAAPRVKAPQAQARAGVELLPVDEPVDSPVVITLRRALARAKPDWNGFLRVSGKGLVPMIVGPASVDRSLAWLADLFAIAESMGHSLDRSGDAVALIVGGERIPFRVEEKPERTPHTPTPKELAEKAKRSQWGYRTNSDPWPKCDHSPSGLLSIVLEANSYSGLRRTFSDGKTQTLETKAEEILAAFAKHSALMIENRRKADEARKAAEIAAARREQQKAFEAREERRGTFVAAVDVALAERAKLQSVLNHLELNVKEDVPVPDGMQAWLQRRLAELDALTSHQFLNISARYAKIDFDEARASAAPPEPSWHYPRAIELQFWSIDEASEQARSQTALEWAHDAGLLPERSEDAEPAK